jgi:20S proteasome alpha/beta subunit
MTLIIALKCKNGTVIASDGRIVVGDIFRTDQKIYQISKGVLVGLAEVLVL